MAKVSQEVLAKIVQRIVEVAQPERIILFGSAAREDMGPHSDIDFLVVKRGAFDPSRLVGDIYMHLAWRRAGSGCDCGDARTGGTLSTHALSEHCPRPATGEGNLPCLSAIRPAHWMS